MEKKKENYANIRSSISLGKVYGFIHFFIGIFALYSSFKCNKGFVLTHSMAACCCPHIYLIYIAAVKGFDFCLDDN